MAKPLPVTVPLIQRSATGCPEGYPWERWFQWLGEGKEVDLQHGVDYHCSSSSMLSTFRFQALRRGIRVKRSPLGEGRISISLALEEAKIGRPEGYPWDDWFKQDLVMLQEGVDYRVPARSMNQAIRMAAKRRNLHVRISLKVEGQITITVLERD